MLTFANKNQLAAAIAQAAEKLPKKNGPLLIAIDGRAGAGKSTLAETLAGLLQGQIVHMDDFFLQPEQRTPQRYAEPGGNVDRERFAAQVLTPLLKNQDARYQVFDCTAMRLGAEKTLVSSKPVIIEGSYSLHPDLHKAYDLKIFLDIDANTQLERIKKRNPLKADLFASRWIPLEEKYIAALKPDEISDLVL